MKRSRSTALALLAASLVLSLLAGCAPYDEPEATAQEPTSQQPADPDLPPFGGTGRQLAENRGEWDLVLTDVRTGSHDGFDRLVLEFAGSGRPGWVVEYVDQAVQEGSGNVIALDGEAILQVVASGTTYPAEGEESFPGGALPDGAGTGAAVSDVHVVGTFEGYTQVFAALEGPPADVRVFRLGNPSRLVVDARAD